MQLTFLSMPLGKNVFRAFLKIKFLVELKNKNCKCKSHYMYAIEILKSSNAYKIKYFKKFMKKLLWFFEEWLKKCIPCYILVYYSINALMLTDKR